MMRGYECRSSTSTSMHSSSNWCKPAKLSTKVVEMSVDPKRVRRQEAMVGPEQRKRVEAMSGLSHTVVCPGGRALTVRIGVEVDGGLRHVQPPVRRRLSEDRVRDQEHDHVQAHVAAPLHQCPIGQSDLLAQGLGLARRACRPPHLVVTVEHLLPDGAVEGVLLLLPGPGAPERLDRACSRNNARREHWCDAPAQRGGKQKVGLKRVRETGTPGQRRARTCSSACGSLA
eukprot:scaffold1802_cov112-Isochrysis_galbana.AAC.1